MFTPAAGFVMALVLVGVGLTMFVEKDYKRQAAEHDPEMILLAMSGGEQLGPGGAQQLGAGSGGDAGGGGGKPLGRGFGLSRSPSAGRLLARRFSSQSPEPGERDPAAEPLLGVAGARAALGGQGWGGLSSAPPVAATWGGGAGGGGGGGQQQHDAASRKGV